LIYLSTVKPIIIVKIFNIKRCNLNAVNMIYSEVKKMFYLKYVLLKTLNSTKYKCFPINQLILVLSLIMQE